MKLYNDNLKSESNPTGIITWKLNDGSYSTEVVGWDNNDFVSCTPEIKKESGGPNSVHNVLSDLYLCVYENSVFDEETGAFVSGDIVATMISDAVAQSGVSSDKVLSFMNATYTIYYDGAKLYVKNSNLGTINFTLADGSLGAGVSIAPSQFATGGLQIYKETMGNPGNMLSNLTLLARGASGFNNYMLGDLNVDYTITASDVLVLSQHLLGIITVNNVEAKGDMNADGIVDSADLTILKMNILGLTE